MTTDNQTGELVRIAALAERWSATPDHAETEYDRGRVDQRHAMTSDLLAVLPSNGSAEFVACSCEPEENGGCEARQGSAPESCSATPIAPTLPHGTQPTERQWQIAEALDDLVMSQGVVLDDNRLDWLVEWVAARETAARVDERERTIAYLRRFPPLVKQQAGIEAAIVWLTMFSSDAVYPL